MPKHLAPEIARHLRSNIEHGVWRTGFTLPNERALAVSYAVARNTIRNALDRLERDGLISRHVGRGTIVNERPSDELVRLMDKISGAAPIDILNLRLIVEPQATAIAATTASTVELAAIAETNDAANAAKSQEAFEQLDNEFHGRIFAATRNEFLIYLHRALSIVRFRPKMQEIRKRAYSAETRELYRNQHEEIIRALERRDAPAAALAMRHHLASRRRNYFDE
jgi:DNA-binding FadR family transcriptional regulator